jgi:ribosomal protein S18 acetylase RimI-like enzyme
LNKFAEFQEGLGRKTPLDRLSIRGAVQGDTLALARLVQERHGGSAGVHADRLAGELSTHSSDSRCLLVAERPDQDILGFGRVVQFQPPAEGARHLAPAGYYLAGVIVDPVSRRRGVARALTAARLEWIRVRAAEVWYFANGRNAVSIALHSAFGFEEVTRDFWHPHASFEGGVGILFRLRLD